MMKFSICVLFCLSLASCTQTSSELHPWQSYGGALSFSMDVNHWASIEPDRLGRVAEDHLAEASEALSERDALEITNERARRLCPTSHLEFNEACRAFLIRGVAYGAPSYSIVRYDKTTNMVYCFQASAFPEFYIPGLRHNPAPAPIVVLLRKKPSKVIAAATVGGDAVFRGVNLQETWRN